MLQAGGYIHSCSNVCCYRNIVVNESEECEIERREASGGKAPVKKMSSLVPYGLANYSALLLA